MREIREWPESPYRNVRDAVSQSDSSLAGQLFLETVSRRLPVRTLEVADYATGESTRAADEVPEPNRPRKARLNGTQ
jgi:hypothetical protein